jgi:putative membrane protein
MTNSTSKDSKAYLFIGILSASVFAFLFWLIYFKEAATASGDWVSYLPALNAILNSITATLLVLGYNFIKKGKKEAHIKTMLLAVGTSALFLVSYILYHHFKGDTKFLAEGIIKYLYFFILISHILLSMIQVPLIFTTLFFAFKKNHIKHKKVARWTFPIWLYVSVTGVLIYVFLKVFN